jgi:putative membrane protein insertion efficiency factor
MTELMRRLLFWIRSAASYSLILLVRGYQFILGPFLGGRCRFQPSCSQYMILAIRKHGPVFGTCKGIWRICRCHPWNEGGYDPP